MFFIGPNAKGWWQMKLSSSSWMSQFQDRRLYDVLIPGTHDSGTEGYAVGWLSRTQYYKISEQLRDGVRFLDMRLTYNAAEENFHVVHAADQVSYLNFDTVVKWCADFLAEHPTETILMSIKQEGADPTSDDKFARRLDAWHTAHVDDDDWRKRIWYVKGNYVPTIKEAAGRIVLLKRYVVAQGDSDGPIFHQGLSLAKINTHKEGSFQIAPGVVCSFQDEYEKEGDAKKKEIAQMLAKMDDNTDGDTHRWYINFASTAKPGPLRAADEINPWLEGQLGFLPGPRYGVILTDYAQPELWRKIFEVNLRSR